MDRIVSRINDSLATPHSRRGFLARLGAVAVGTGAALAGIGSAAAACSCPTPICSTPYPNCPAGTSYGSMYCCASGGYYYPYIACAIGVGGPVSCWSCNGNGYVGHCPSKPAR